MNKTKKLVKTDRKTKGIREEYAEIGVTEYYESKGNTYTNPHFPQIRQLLLQNQHRLDYSKVLDFCCGSGEVSQVLQELKYPLPIACDPFTQKAYQTNFDRECLSFSFEDVIRRKLNGNFSTIICSFAMHLCPEKQLYPLVANLFALSPNIVIITPHKRPVLERLTNVELTFEDFVLTERGKKIRLKSYGLKLYSLLFQGKSQIGAALKP